MSNILTAQQLREILSYDAETGTFTWRVHRGPIKPGMVAGTAWTDGRGNNYIVITIKGHKHLAHRLAWLHTKGFWPDHFVDHIDMNGLNNCIKNLREATRSQNLRNRGAAANNKSGFKGVSLDKPTGRWLAHITVNARQKNLGRFNTPEDAYAAYCAAAQKLHGEFARME